MYIEGLDEIDNRILTILETEARLSYSEIGERVGVSRVSVKNRMEILEKKGIIQGYTAVINQTNLPEGRRFFLEIVTEPEAFNTIIDNIAGYDIIRKIYAVTGECRLRAEGFAPNNLKYDTFMRSIKRNLEGVKGIAIQDVLYTVKDVDGGVEYERTDEGYTKDTRGFDS